MAIHAIGDQLHKFSWEVEQLTPDDFADQIAWFQIKRQEEEKSLREAKAKAHAQSRRTRR
jgi:hypothetical protein